MKKTLKKMLGIAAAATLALSLGSVGLIGCGGGTDYTFEAEDAVLGGNAVAEEGKHLWTSAETLGEGETVDIVGYFTAEGDTITWTINASKACSATITVTAASGVAPEGAAFSAFVFDEEGNAFWRTQEIDTSKNEVFTLSVNGEQASLTSTLPGLDVAADMANMMFYFDDGFNNHGTCTAKVKLKEGDNTIVLAAVSAGVNVDKITIKAPAELTAK